MTSASVAVKNNARRQARTVKRGIQFGAAETKGIGYQWILGQFLYGHRAPVARGCSGVTTIDRFQ